MKTIEPFVNKVVQGDCMKVMPHFPAQSIDMILCDLPYGIINTVWDNIIPIEPLWNEYKRIIKPNGAIVLTGTQPFMAQIISANIDWYKYEWIWVKNRATGFANAKKVPLVAHENIAVFYKKAPNYNPQGIAKIDKKIVRRVKSGKVWEGLLDDGKWALGEYVQEFANYPQSVLEIDCSNVTGGSYHPTEKPVELFEYLVRTYTNEGDLVLDNTAGSGTTGVACIRSKRRYIMIEKMENYVKTCQKRVGQAQVAEDNRTEELW